MRTTAAVPTTCVADARTSLIFGDRPTKSPLHHRVPPVVKGAPRSARASRDRMSEPGPPADGLGNTSIRPGSRRDAEAVARICNHYIESGHHVLRESPVSPIEMAERLAAGAAGVPGFVLEREGAVVGYSYSTPWPGPKVHPSTVETTIYLAPEVCGLGLGRRLYTALLSALEERRIHTAIGCISLPNQPSRALHARLGFSPMTVLAGAAEKHGRCYDLECWAKRLGRG